MDILAGLRFVFDGSAKPVRLKTIKSNIKLHIFVEIGEAVIAFILFLIGKQLFLRRTRKASCFAKYLTVLLVATKSASGVKMETVYCLQQGTRYGVLILDIYVDFNCVHFRWRFNYQVVSYIFSFNCIHIFRLSDNCIRLRTLTRENLNPPGE